MNECHPTNLIIHPIDGDLRFLKKLINALTDYYVGSIKYLKLKNNAKSHYNALNSLKTYQENGLVCIFCHGRSTGILGCCYQCHRVETNDEDQSLANNNMRYEHGDFIHAGNIEVLKNQKIFCLSCNSNEIGDMAISAGTKVFIGFDDIDFEYKKYLNNDPPNPNKHVIANTKYELRKAVYLSLIQGFDEELSFYYFAKLLKLYLNKASDRLVLNYKNHRGKKYYFRVANNLQLIKDGIKIFGDVNLKLLG